jgi:hypothetical protein
MNPEKESREVEAVAAAERLAMADLFEMGFLLEETITGGSRAERWQTARTIEARLKSDGRETMILQGLSWTRVLAKRPKRKEPA